MLTDFMYIKAEHEKYISMPLRMSIASLTGILVGPKVLSVASQTVLLHILGSRGAHIFLQIDHEIISKVILTPSAAQHLVIPRVAIRNLNPWPHDRTFFRLCTS